MQILIAAEPLSDPPSALAGVPKGALAVIGADKVRLLDYVRLRRPQHLGCG